MQNLVQYLKNKDKQIEDKRRKMYDGDAQILNQYMKALNVLLENKEHHDIAYAEINQLCISAHHLIIIELNNSVFPQLARKHCRSNLKNYVVFWARVYNGKHKSIDYPNVAVTLNKILQNASQCELPPQFEEFERQLNCNMLKLKEKKVEFFEDFDGDSFISESMYEASIENIIEIDVEQMKKIRNLVQNEPINEVQAKEYLAKINKFNQLKPKTLKKQLSQDFNIQRVWAKDYINSYHDIYLKQGKLSFYHHFRNQKYHQFKDVYQNSDSNISFQSGAEDRNVKKLKPKSKVAIESDKKLETAKFINSQKMGFLKIIENEGQKRKNSENSIQIKINEEKSSVHLNEVQKKQAQGTRYKINQIASQNNNSKAQNRSSRIFGKRRRIFQEQPDDDQLVVKKHKMTLTPTNNIYVSDVERYGRNTCKPTIQNPLNNVHQKSKINNEQIAYFHPQECVKMNQKKEQVKKFSHFNKQKKMRRNFAPLEYISQIKDYVLRPYSKHFDQVCNFTRFRRNCLEDNFILYASPLLVISCTLLRQSDFHIRIQLNFENRCSSNLMIQTIYRIPKCFKIQKVMPIHKEFVISDEFQHVFGVQLLSFPLEPCILNLKYGYECSEMNHRDATILILPITLRNFIQFFILGEDQWKKRWAKWNQNRGTNMQRNIFVDGVIVEENRLQLVLKQFTQISGIEGYSAKELGALCSYNNLELLLRISLRVDNLLSLEITSERELRDKDERDLAEYFLDVWTMILSKLTNSDLL